MKTIGFIGAFDKTDMILNVAKILTLTKKKILIIDATILQRSRYIVPVINPTRSYITTFEEIDVAVGFESIEDIKKYLAISSNEAFEYDILLVDCDNIESFNAFELREAAIKYFVTSFGPYPLKRGVEILSEFRDVLPFKKVLFSRYMSNEEDEYLNFLTTESKVNWEQDKVYFPHQEGDLHVNLENQMSEKISFKELSEGYKEAIAYLCEEILGNEKASSAEVRRVIRSL